MEHITEIAPWLKARIPLLKNRSQLVFRV